MNRRVPEHVASAGERQQRQLDLRFALPRNAY